MLPALERDSHKYLVMLNWKGWACTHVSPRICRQTCSRFQHRLWSSPRGFLKDYMIMRYLAETAASKQK